MTPTPATPVPVTPPQVPPRPPLWVVIEPPLRRSGFQPGRNPWDWTGFPDVYDTEQAAQDYANEHPGSVIFRLPGSAELADPLTRQLTDSIAAVEGRKL